MSMSLDGFIAGPNERPDNPLGDGGHRLHEWVLTDADADHKEVSGRLVGVNGQVVDEFMATGAVVAGRGTFESAAAGAATTTTASRSGSSAATSPAST
jgi:dihydrofolate reductase